MDSSDQENLDRARFTTILQNLKRGSIPSFASAVRYSGHLSTGIIDKPTTPRPISCRLLSQITCGSFNAIFKVLFADGTIWVLKVPANGHHQCWNESAKEALISEAFTMRLIKRETTIPVPEVFAFDATLENELGCPFVLMELMHGKLLQDMWFDQGMSQALREQIRVRSLHGIAEAMTQLNSLAFSQGGSLLFDSKGDVLGIGSSNVVDLETQYANMRSTDYDNTMAFRQTGPFNDPKTYLMSLLDAYVVKCERCDIEQGAHELLRLFIEWSIADTSAEEKPFVLAHPDLDKQNILVNDDGSLAGIIDLDSIAAVPRHIGCQSLPKFLTQDYDPATYAYDVDAGAPIEGYIADSPAELACYRAIYAQSMESYLSKEDRVNSAKSRRHAVQIRKSRKQAADITRRSLVIGTLHLAAKAPSQMKKQMEHLFDRIEELTAAQWPDESSTVDPGEQEDSEEAGEEEEETEATDVEDRDVVREPSCTCSTGSKEKAVSIEHLSIDGLMDEIEKLTGVPSAGNSNHENTLDPTKLEDTSTSGRGLSLSAVEAQDLGTGEHTKQAQKPKAARVCGWLKKKLRRGAERLYKKPKKDDPNASADLRFGSTPFGAARTLCGWTEEKFRRVAHCLHCNNDDDNDEVNIDSKIEALQNGGIDVLQSLQKKLTKLKEKLHRKGINNFEVSEVNEAKSLQDHQIANASKELARAEKQYICGKFAHMIQDNKLCLTLNQQVAVAQWVIQTLQMSDLSDMDLDATRNHTQGRVKHCEARTCGGYSHQGNDSGYEEGQEGGDGCHNKEEVEIKIAEKVGLKAEAEDYLEAMDRACVGQPSAALLAGSEEMKSGEEELSEVRQAGNDPEEKVLVQEDGGAFDLFDICVALAKDNLDERRMQRLQDGFFGLLNQTL